MILFPPAKINLGLSVLFKREDGYHEISTCMIPIPLFDILEILKKDDFSFKQSGITIPGGSSDNLCVKAYELMRGKYQIPPVYMHLRKQIPMGAGMGGGSADAAYVLKGLNALFELNCAEKELEEMAAQLGSDCPFFIKNEAQMASGRGELLAPSTLTLHGYYLKIINPGIHVGTKEAYAGIQFGGDKKSIETILATPISNWKDQLVNDFEKTVFNLHPSLAEIKNQLYLEGALYAAMSGSGSTLFGIFKTEPTRTFQDSTNYLEEILVL